MPERLADHLLHRHLDGAQQVRQLIDLIEFEQAPAAGFGESLQAGTIRFQARPFRHLRLPGPAAVLDRLQGRQVLAGRPGRGRLHPPGPGCLGKKLGLKQAGLGQARLGWQAHLGTVGPADLKAHQGVVHRAEIGLAHAQRESHARFAGFHRQLHAVGHVDHQPAHELAPEALLILHRGGIAQAPAPDIADRQGHAAAFAKALGDEGRMRGVGRGHGGEHAGAGLDREHRVDRMKAGHGGEPALLLVLAGAQAGPGFEPALATEVEAGVAHRFDGTDAVEVHRQQAADRRVLITAGLKAFLPAEHEQGAAALGDKAFEQVHLFLGEKLRLQVVEHHRAVLAKQGVGAFWKTLGQFLGVLRAQADQHGLIVALGRRLIAKTAKQRVAALAHPAAPLELRLALGDADQRGQLHLRIAGEGAAEEFVLPVRATGHVEHAVGTLAAVDGDLALVVDPHGLVEQAAPFVLGGLGQQGGFHEGDTQEGDARLGHWHLQARHGLRRAGAGAEFF